jgi:predicted flavoprotein YhiN
MRRHFGGPIKGVAWSAGTDVSRGEAVVSSGGLEGGGVYSLSATLRGGAALHIDLLPDQTVTDIRARLLKSRGKASLSNHLRKALRLSAVKIALLQEWARPLPEDSAELASLIKALPVPYTGLNSMDQAISTNGGVAWSAVDPALMLHDRPGVFVAGEMLDWEAPTGGYLLTACFATGRWAGISAARHLGIHTDFHADRS